MSSPPTGIYQPNRLLGKQFLSLIAQNDLFEVKNDKLTPKHNFVNAVPKVIGALMKAPITNKNLFASMLFKFFVLTTFKLKQSEINPNISHLWTLQSRTL